jgi:hypothetical protein
VGVAVAAAALLRLSIAPEPPLSDRELSAAAVERLRTAAGKTAAWVGLAVAHADFVSELWTCQKPEDLDAEEILRFAEDASSWAEALLAESQVAVEACGASERPARRRFPLLLGEACRSIRLRP